MIIDCVSDLHGFYPDLEGGDILIVAGDLTAHGQEHEYFQFFDWIHAQNYLKKIVIGGNHDTQMQDENYKGPEGIMKHSFDYLCDSETEFEGLKIWGSPWTKSFAYMNPNCKAFCLDSDSELEEKWKLIPKDIDILITHSPPWSILDKTIWFEKVGSKSLLDEVARIRPKLHIFGHIHESYGQETIGGSIYVNASYVNRDYQPVNNPIRIIL